MESKKNNLFSGEKRIKDKLKNCPLYGRTLIILLLIAFILKGFVIYFSYKNLDPWKNVISFLMSDIIILFFTHFLITINFLIRKRKWRLVNDIIVFIILVIFVVDIFTIFVFQSRVTIMDVLNLGSNGSAGFSGMIRLWVSISIVIGLITFLAVQINSSKSSKLAKNMIIIFSICSIFYSLFYVGAITTNVKLHHVENVISLNLQKIFLTDDINHINEEVGSGIKKGAPGYEDYIKPISGRGKDLNVILVFAESLSAIDSANMGGNNKMPKFDAIQKDGITFTNFVTNGTTSDTAHISSLLGVIPLINMRMGNTPYGGYRLKMKALPDFLNSEGYMTTFISAASLNFLKQRDFLSLAGFQKIIGEEEFEDNKKYTFESAPDGELYDRVLQEIQAQTGKYFIGLQTISFHKPYNTPLGKTEDLALQYSDEELFRFYERLREIGFFDNGILVIIGDHRKMNAIEEGERDIFGSNRYTKSVATVVGSGINAGTINSQLVQHTDFYNSLKRLVGHGKVFIDSTYNDIFTQETNRNRGITNSEFYENNRYTVSSHDGDILLFRNISNLSKDNPIYDYFSSYVSFEFGDKDKRYEEENEVGNTIKFIGHRGAIEHSPENTIESFLEANKLGADGIEFDVSYTKDHENLVVHGDFLYASNCNKRKIGNLNFDWIQKNCTIKNGEKYMKLQKMLELVDGLFDYYFLEIKVYDEKLGAQQTLDAIQTVKNLNMQDRVIFISYSDSAREILNSYPDILFGWDTFDINDLNFIGENNSKYFLAPYDMLTPEVVQKAKSLGKEVVTYTVNTTGDFQTMKHLGVNIIMSDRVDLLQEYNKQYYPEKHKVKNINLKKSSR